MEITSPDDMAGMLGLPKSDNLVSVHKALQTYGPQEGLHRPHRLAMFLAQAGHESEGFKYDRELWGPTAAQKRYDTRTDLGNTPERDGDGYKNRGRGPFQLTGGYNISMFHGWCVEKFGAVVPDFTENPDLINTDPWEGLSAIWYWSWRGLNAQADSGDFNGLTRVINGGYNGLTDRRRRWGQIGLAMLGYGSGDVREFQRAAGLKPDNVVGPLTLKAMHQALVDMPDVLFTDPDPLDQPVTKTPSPLSRLLSWFGHLFSDLLT